MDGISAAKRLKLIVGMCSTICQGLVCIIHVLTTKKELFHPLRPQASTQAQAKKDSRVVLRRHKGLGEK
eukprot:9210332-Karenia_brevis.AAC.1